MMVFVAVSGFAGAVTVLVRVCEVVEVAASVVPTLTLSDRAATPIASSTRRSWILPFGVIPVDLCCVICSAWLLLDAFTGLPPRVRGRAPRPSLRSSRSPPRRSRTRLASRRDHEAEH
jgi:hypothetical protein